jgi:hypothetical protein
MGGTSIVAQQNFIMDIKGISILPGNSVLEGAAIGVNKGNHKLAFVTKHQD